MFRPALLALVALGTPHTAQTIWTVDDDGPANFANLQLAVDAASDGDTLLVRAGVYPRIVVDGKGLILQGQGAPQLQAALFAAPTLTVRNLAVDQELHVRGFTTLSLAFAEQENVLLENNAGSLLFEECFLGNAAGESVVARDCASVTFVDCQLVAAPTFASIAGTFFLAHVPYTGLVADKTELFLYDCVVTGSFGGDSGSVIFFDTPPAPAGAGIALFRSTLLASGCTITGGSAGSGVVGCYAGEDGAPGLRVLGGAFQPPSTARLLDCTVTGGTGGTGSCGLADGVDAPALEVALDATVESLPGLARSFSPASPTTAGSPLDLSFAGEPGDLLLVHVALGIRPGLTLESLGLALHLTWPTAVIGFGALPASGVLDTQLPLPPLPGYDHIVFVGQCLFIGQAGYFDGGPRTVLLTSPGL